MPAFMCLPIHPSCQCVHISMPQKWVPWIFMPNVVNTCLEIIIVLDAIDLLIMSVKKQLKYINKNQEGNAEIRKSS